MRDVRKQCIDADDEVICSDVECLTNPCTEVWIEQHHH
jgi:hypothetical protein